MEALAVIRDLCNIGDPVLRFANTGYVEALAVIRDLCGIGDPVLRFANTGYGLKTVFLVNWGRNHSLDLQ
jgi:hypothetical protein